MQMAPSAQNEVEKRNPKDVKRLNLANYTEARILETYDWSVKERVAHDKMMENYRRYLMKLSTLSQETAEWSSEESE